MANVQKYPTLKLVIGAFGTHKLPCAHIEVFVEIFFDFDGL